MDNPDIQSCFSYLTSKTLQIQRTNSIQPPEYYSNVLTISFFLLPLFQTLLW